MYEAYLDIYKFASSMSRGQVPFLTPESNEKEAKVDLADRLGRRDSWSYRVIYSAIWSSFAIYPMFLLPDRRDVVPIAIAYCLIGLAHGWLMYALVLRYHKSNPLEVYKYGKLEYEDLYPKKLRRRLWWWNAIPFVYFTFGIVPIVTRIHYFVVAKLEPNLPAEKPQKSEEGALAQYTHIRNFIERRISSPGEGNNRQLKLLKILFERRISEITSHMQRLTVLLSLLGIVIPVVVYLGTSPLGVLQKWLSELSPMISSRFLQGSITLLSTLPVLGIVGLVVAFVFYFWSQLQIQNGKRRDMSILLDAIDVMLVEQ